jgi:hypothetical protein
MWLYQIESLFSAICYLLTYNHMASLTVCADTANHIHHSIARTPGRVHKIQDVTASPPTLIFSNIKIAPNGPSLFMRCGAGHR